MGYTFVSYSRKQLYFAEALVQHLLDHEIATWFDLQHLGNGVDWPTVLKEGYEKCQNMVLVASQASLSSPFVEREWKTALGNGREVILAVVENLVIPAELSNCPVFDFRSGFDAPARELTAYLALKGPSRHDPIPKPGSFPYPLAMPLSIWITLAALILPIISTLLLIISFFPGSLKQAGNEVITLFPLGVTIAGSLCYQILRFWGHNLDYRSLRYSSIISLLLQAYIILLHAFGDNGNQIQGWILILLGGSILLNLFFYFGISNYSPSFLRWFQAGQVPQSLRRRFHGRLLDKDRRTGSQEYWQGDVHPISFCLHHDPADQPLADKLQKILCNQGHLSVSSEEANQQIFILTNLTSRTQLAEALDHFGAQVMILVGSPRDLWTDLSDRDKLQVYELRGWERQEMVHLAKNLSDPAAWQRQCITELDRVQSVSFRVPAGIQLFRFAGYNWAAALIAAGIFPIGYALIDRSSNFMGIWIASGLWLASILSLTSGLVLYVFIQRAFLRRLPFLSALLIMPGIPMLLALLFGQLRNPTLLMANTIIWPGLLFILLNNRSWFPAKAPMSAESIGIEKSGRRRAWGLWFTILATIVNLILTLLITLGV